MPELPNPKREAFCREYLLDLNGTQAAVRAGYSPRTANEQAARLLADVSVAARVAELKAARAERTETDADRVIAELKRIAFADRRRLFAWGPDGVRLIPSDQLDPADAAIVTEITETTTEGGGSIRLKTADKLGALTLLGRHLGLFADKLKLETDAPPDLSALTDAQRSHLLAALRGLFAGPTAGGVGGAGA